jgi:pyruvate kinase
VPGVPVPIPSLTRKDMDDLEFALVELDVDFVALSFVRSAADVRDLKDLIQQAGSTANVIAKIEKAEAVDALEVILEEADAVMVARGDLGVEIGPELVPLLQKRIIIGALDHGKPVITATQMLESMIHQPEPTRAEASDVANAIIDGTDAVMLSAETAAGAYPRLAVQAMRRIVCEIEQHPFKRAREGYIGPEIIATTEETIAAATDTAQRMLGAPIIIVFTKSGFSARIVSAHRPQVPILALTDEPRTFSQLALVWGIIPQLVQHCETYEAMVARAREVVLTRGLAKEGDRVLVTAGVPFDVPGTTNVLRVERV